MTYISMLKTLLITTAVLALFAFATTKPTAQSTAPARAGHVNDFAGVVDTATRERLERILENLQEKTGIQFDLATVQSTAGEDIFDFSGKIAREWNTGAINTKRKSLLFVVSVDDKVSVTRFSRTVQADLPEDLIGNMAQRTRTLLRGGQTNTAITDAVEYFVNSLGKRLAFSLEDLDRATRTVATTEPSPTAPSENPTEASITTPVVLKTPEATRQRIVSASPSPQRPSANRSTTADTARVSTDDADEAEEVEVTLALPLIERIATLKKFIEGHPKSKSLMRARELLVSAHAAMGDSLLGNRDSTGGVEQLMLAINEAPVDASEKLYSGVIAQIPMNLYLRDERVAAFEAAQKIEDKFGNDVRRLLGLTSFYLGIERGDQAVRLAQKAVALNPDLAEAHYSLGLALHISLRLEEAAAEYKRAAELDANFSAARRSLADLNRAHGKTEEALAFYRERAAADPKDRAARTGLVLSLLDLSRNEEAERELEATLKDDPNNVTLLSGVAYWFAAHKDTKRALELAQKAVAIEPRYTWSQVALARALIGERRPLEAERALRFAQQYGKFPTLDYELATALAAAGLYDEAADALKHSFTLRNGQLETRLGGRNAKSADNFIDLLSPERQASLFQPTAADTAENAKMLKALLAFTAANDSSASDDTLISAAKGFAAGEDKMRAYRQLYVASRLLRQNRALDVARELAEAARSAVDDAMESPAVTVAAQADELRDIRARAIASGGTPDVAEAPREVLANIIRGRSEDLSGWALFNQDQYSEAVVHLQKAANILPEATPSWRTAMWHLGAALEQTGRKEDALNAYIKSYLSGERDAARRALIERLYVQVNGSLDGLDQRIGPGPSAAAIAQPAETTVPAASPETTQKEPAPSEPTKTVTPTNAEPTETPKPQEQKTTPPVNAESTPTPTAPSSPTPEPQPQPSESPSPSPEVAAPTPTPAEQPRPLSSEPTLADVPPKPPSVLKVSGRIKDASGNGIANVVVVLISPRGSVLASTTDSEGNYTFTVSPSEKPFRLVPSKDGFVFDPVDKSLVIHTEDRTADFLGKEQPVP